MAADSSNLLGLYILVPVYFCFLFGAALWGMYRMKRHKAKLKSDGDSPEDSLTRHYLGGRSFGPVLTAGTMFASFFSGCECV
mmetsp:Transcript_23815/g.51795  ORF Transcript_23815/g.51795 Transcript_23815/m.51795 type:complete len:82 (-) Transcript_23815:373-618(-)